MFLLDTNVVSEFRRPRPHPRVLKWIDRIRNDRLFVTAVTVGELQAGIEITRESDMEKAEQLSRWLETVVAGYNIISMEAPDFREWARLKHRKPASLFQDAMIAAMARIRGMIVVTRNIRDFSIFEVDTLNPFGEG